MQNAGKSTSRVLNTNYLINNRPDDHIQFQGPRESALIFVVNSNTIEYILGNIESTSNTQSNKHMTNLRRRSTIDYKNLNFHLSHGELAFLRNNDSFVIDCPLVTNYKYNTFICTHEVLPASNCTTGLLCFHMNSTTSNHLSKRVCSRNVRILDTSSYHIIG